MGSLMGGGKSSGMAATNAKLEADNKRREEELKKLEAENAAREAELAARKKDEEEQLKLGRLGFNALTGAGFAGFGAFKPSGGFQPTSSAAGRRSRTEVAKLFKKTAAKPAAPAVKKKSTTTKAKSTPTPPTNIYDAGP